MEFLYNELIYKPLFNSLVLLYDWALNDLGLAIILLTLLVRIILFPLFHRSLKHQKLIQELQPEIKRIQEKIKNREEQTKAILAIYKAKRVNPVTPFLLLMLQIPILIALYQIFAQGFSEGAFKALYPFIERPAIESQSFLGIVDLSKNNLWLAVIATLAQYYQSKISLPLQRGGTLTPAERASRQMVYLIPGITLIFLINLPAAIGVYWITTTVFSIIQQMIVNNSAYHERTRKDNYPTR